MSIDADAGHPERSTAAHRVALRIRSVRVRGLDLRPERPTETAAGTMATTPLVLIDLHTDEDVTGHSYVRTYTSAALAPMVELLSNLCSLIEGSPAIPVGIEATLRAHFRLLGTAGLAGMAIAGIETAVWDALARACGVPLVRLLGGEPTAIPAYASLRSMSPARAAAEAEAAAAGGFRAVKVKIGRGSLADDLDTVRAIRGAVGESVNVMADYNQSLSVPEAINRIRILDEEGLYWIEEPTRAGDLHGSARIAANVRTPIQLGENWSALSDVATSVSSAASHYATLDVIRIGGITGWRHAAGITAAAGVPVSSHTFGELSAHLLAVTPIAHWLEYLDHAGPILAQPLHVAQGMAIANDGPGSGIEWDEDKIRHALARQP